MSEIVTRPATHQYREGWERAFGKGVAYANSAEKDRAESQVLPPRSTSESASLAKHSPESPTPATVDGSGLPALFPIQVKCPACHAQPYEDCFLISAEPCAVPSLHVSYIHDARRKVASEARAN